MTKILFFSTKDYDQAFFTEANHTFGFKLNFLNTPLNTETAHLAQGFTTICVFVHDQLDQAVLTKLQEYGVKLIILRCAGFNHADIATAVSLGITIARVPEYSPHAVAEHTVALLLALNRKIHKAYPRAKEGNFSLTGLIGKNLQGKTIGVIGTGKIGSVVAKILQGFGTNIIAYDPQPNPNCLALGITYVELAYLYQQADIITLHCPLNPQTHYLINENAIATMKNGVTLINTSRGAVIKTTAVIQALKKGKLAGVALDVYEHENDVFFEDLSNNIIQDDMLERLFTFPNVLITGHQGFLTEEALTNIALTSLNNVKQFLLTSHCGQNEITIP